MAKPRGQQELRTYEQVARALGVPASTVRSWALQNAPIYSGKPNDLAEIRAWVESWHATNPPKGGGKSNGEKSPEARKLAEWKLALEIKGREHQNALLKVKVDRAQENVVSLAEAQAEIRAMARTLRAALLGIPHRMADRLVGKPRAEIESMLRSSIDQALLTASQDPVDSE